MSFESWVIFSPYFLSALISLVVSLQIFRRERIPGAVRLARLAALEALWTIGYILQIVATDLPVKLFWNNVQFIGAIFAPVAFFYFSIEYGGFKDPFLRRVRIFISMAAIALCLLVWTDGWHHLFRVDFNIQQIGPFPRLVYTDGPAFILFPLLGYATLSLGAYALIKNLLSASRIYRLQTLTVLVGILIPWLTSLVIWLGLVEAKLHDIVPLTFAISNLIVFWALARFGLFDLVPVAYDTLLDHMADALILLDDQKRMIDLNQTAQRLLNLSHTDAIGIPFHLAHPAFAGLLRDKPANHTVEVLLTVSGNPRHFEMRQMELHDPLRSMAGWLVLLRDISEIKENEARLQRLAITDPLTEIYNRRQFFTLGEAELKRAIRSRLPLAVLLLDIDYFKDINDQFGHLAGDQVLQLAVSRLQLHLRPYDIIARYGGDEFIILLPETDVEAAMGIAARLRECICTPAFITQAGPVTITTSIGVSDCQFETCPRLEHLIDQADQALYAAKQAGRNTVCLCEQPGPLPFPQVVEKPASGG